MQFGYVTMRYLQVLVQEVLVLAVLLVGIQMRRLKYLGLPPLGENSSAL